MLHIVNGESFADKLMMSGIKGEILVWRESLYEGPAGLDLAESEMLKKRALYFDQKYGVPTAHFMDSTLQQEKALLHIHRGEHVVLWFEHDLYDQLMLSYLLYKLAHMARSQFQLSLLCIGDFPGVELFQGLGQLTPEQVATLEGTWNLVTDDQLAHGCKVWEAYTASEPLLLEELVQRDCSALPYMKEALEIHLKRLPSIENGLHLIQQLVLELVQQGEKSVMHLFGQMGELVNAYGLGDLQFWGIIESMRHCAVPLVELRGVNRLPRFGEKLPEDFASWELELTPAGHQVLVGEQDHIHLNGVDDSIGGVHLHGKGGIWRWDASMKRVMKL